MAISKSIHSFVDDEHKEYLEHFENKKFAELHQEVLHDEGMPDLIKKVREITRDLNKRMGMDRSQKDSSVTHSNTKKL